MRRRLGADMCRRFAFAFSILGLVLALASPALAHGFHSAQSPSIIDPLVTHHAVLEDELKVNYFGVRDGAKGAFGNSASLELAYVFTDWLGFETFIPYQASGLGGTAGPGLGDIELQFPKLSFVRNYGLVMSTYTAVTLPTGDQAAGAGKGEWGLAPHFLTDMALGPMGVQANGAIEWASGGDLAAELKSSLAYTLIVDTEREISISPLVEAVGDMPLKGGEPASWSWVPGVKIAYQGWHLGTGVVLPFAGERPFDYQVLLQLGYHVVWNRLIQ